MLFSSGPAIQAGPFCGRIKYMSDSTPPFDAEISLDAVIEHAQTLADHVARIPPRTESPLRQPIFVVGSPRSGTTALGRCLGAHSQCATAEESLVLLPLWRIYADLYAVGLPTGVAHLKEYVSESELLSSLGDFSDRIFTGLLERTGAATYVDHTPWYGVLTPFVRALYPDARFVHVVRDGRQVVRSLKAPYEKGFAWAGADHATRCAIWRTMVDGTDRALSATAPEQAIQVRYHRLCADPESTLRGLAERLALPYESGMETPLRTQHARSQAGVTFGTAALTTHYTEAGWPTHWDADHIDTFTDIAGPTMERAFGSGWQSSPQ